MTGPITFSDLFAGVGGFRLVLQSLGMECIFSSEINVQCCDTYEANFGERPFGDITKINEKLIPSHDILCGGFPCQPFSIAGKKDGFKDPRGGLFYDIARIVSHTKPKILFLENVKNLITHDGGKTLSTMIKELNRLGYSVFYSSLNASDYGSVTSRSRVYIVAFHKKLGINSFYFPKAVYGDIALEDIIDNFVDANYFIDRKNIIIETDVKIRSNSPIRVGSVGLGRQGERIYSSKGHAITFSSSGGGLGRTSGLYLINGKVRRLTPRECFRAMGFPETFKIKQEPNIAYHQIGNSVSISTVQAVLGSIVQTAFRRTFYE